MCVDNIVKLRFDAESKDNCDDNELNDVNDDYEKEEMVKMVLNVLDAKLSQNNLINKIENKIYQDALDEVNEKDEMRKLAYKSPKAN